MAEFETIRRTGAGARARRAVDEGLRAHMNKVYGLMAVAMVITGLAAWMTCQACRFPTFRTESIRCGHIFLTDFGAGDLYAAVKLGDHVRAPGICVRPSRRHQPVVDGDRTVASSMAFAAAMGLSISWIFLVFTGMSIAQIFLVTAIAFAGLSLWGYTTQKDISGWGSFLFMGVIGL